MNKNNMGGFRELTNRLTDLASKVGFEEFLEKTKNTVYWNSIPEEIYYQFAKRTRGKEVLREIQGSKMLLDLLDEGIQKELFLRGIREPESTEIFKSELSSGLNVIDIGASVGYYALMEARIVGDKGTVFAIEPTPSIFKKLVKNIELNDYLNVRPYNLALGEREGKAQLEMSDHSNYNRIAMQPSEKTVEVEMRTLDKFLEKQEIDKVDVVRMDVEGFEYKIFQGMEETLKNNSMKLFVEIHSEQIKSFGGSVESTLKRLSGLGFLVKYIVGNSFPPTFLDYLSRGPPSSEVFKFNKSINSLLENQKIRNILLNKCYHIFLEKC